MTKAKTITHYTGLAFGSTSNFLDHMVNNDYVALFPLSEGETREEPHIFHEDVEINVLIHSVQVVPDSSASGLLVTFETVGKLPPGVRKCRVRAFFDQDLICTDPPKRLFK